MIQHVNKIVSVAFIVLSIWILASTSPPVEEIPGFYDHFFECMSGPEHYVETDCVIYDYNHDYDVDLQDFATFQCQYGS